MKIKIFKVDNFPLFKNVHTPFAADEYAADCANNLLQAILEKSTIVYGKWPHPFWNEENTLENKQDATHKAHLMFIEEIPKTPCKHEPDIQEEQLVNAIYSIMKDAAGPNISGAKCKWCKVEMVAEWKAK